MNQSRPSPPTTNPTALPAPGARGAGPLVALLLAVATLAVAWWHVELVQFFCDDSYISYRYSQNFAEGHGLVYNPGERVEGYTNFLWVILVGVAMKAGIGAEPASLALGLLFLAVTLAATAVYTRRLTQSWAFALVPCLLLVCQGPMILWSTSGLEASCYAAMTLLALLAYERWFERPAGLLLTGALFGLSTMVRPDGVVFGGAAGLHLILCGLLAPLSGRPLELGRLCVRGSALAAGFLLAFGPFVLWRHAYYGDWLPNTFYIKAGGALNLQLGLDYLATWFREYPIAGVLTVAGLLGTLLLPRFRASRRSFALLALSLTLFCGYLAWAGGDYMALYRFLVPLLPLAMVPATALLQALFEGAGRFGLPAALRAVAGLLLLAGGGYALTLPSRGSVAGIEQSRAIATVKRMKRNSLQWELLGKTLHAKFGELPRDQQPVMAITAAGAAPFFAELPTIDQSGLCDRHVAKVESDPWLLDRPGHMKQATRAYLATRKPDLIFWHPQLKEAGKPAREFVVAPTPDYELRAMAVDGLTAETGECVYFWVRKDRAAELTRFGIVPPAESAQWRKAGSTATPATEKLKARDQMAAAMLAELEQEPPPEPPSIDPPLPPRHDGPRFNTRRIGAADPAEVEPRFSIADVTRPLWHDTLATPIEFTGAAGSWLEFDVASVPALTPDGAVATAAGIRVPQSIAAALVTASGRVELKTRLVDPAPAGSSAWRRVRAELSGVPAGPAELSVAIDGADAHAAGAKRSWFVSVPRIHQDTQGDERPNVLVITVDTLRADYLRCYGHDRPTSSNLDGLAKAGVVFERNLAQASWTLPSYSSCFSGQYTEAHGVTHRDHRFAGHFVTWPELLARDGYALGGFVSGTFTDAHWGMDQGFDQYDDLGMVVNEAHAASVQAHNGLTPDQPEAMKTAAHRRLTSPEIANKSIAFLDAHRDRRFCLLAHFFDPHEDYVRHPKINPHFPDRPVPPGFPNQVDRFPEVTARMRALYEAEIAYTDFHIGRVLKRLVDLGLAEKTIVVVFSDHGEAFKEHILDPRPEFDHVNCGHGSSLYNEQIHVPLIFRAPGITPGRVKTPTGNLDIGPTLLELCAVDPGDWIHHGRSLVPAMQTKEPDPERLVFSSMFRAMPAEGDPDGKRRMVAHRVDQDDLAALSQGRIQSLHRWSNDRWQDPAKNLLPQQQQTFAGLEDVYQQRREMLEALQQSAVPVSNDGLNDTLKELGYTGG